MSAFKNMHPHFAFLHLDVRAPAHGEEGHGERMAKVHIRYYRKPGKCRLVGKDLAQDLSLHFALPLETSDHESQNVPEAGLLDK